MHILGCRGPLQGRAGHGMNDGTLAATEGRHPQPQVWEAEAAWRGELVDLEGEARGKLEHFWEWQEGQRAHWSALSSGEFPLSPGRRKVSCFFGSFSISTGAGSTDDDLSVTASGPPENARSDCGCTLQ